MGSGAKPTLIQSFEGTVGVPEGLGNILILVPLILYD